MLHQRALNQQLLCESSYSHRALTPSFGCAAKSCVQDKARPSYLLFPNEMYIQSTISSKAEGLFGLAANILIKGIDLIIVPSPKMDIPKIYDSDVTDCIKSL